MENIKEKNFISAVVYVHNSERYIADFMKRLIKIIEGNFEHSEIIFVNDFSNDDCKFRSN
jgi:dolichol-phosphate mannosyltransferase